jgi:ketosteroid isomerase-like protein
VHRVTKAARCDSVIVATTVSPGGLASSTVAPPSLEVCDTLLGHGGHGGVDGRRRLIAKGVGAAPDKRRREDTGLTDLKALDRVIDASHEALDAFVRGDSEPFKALYSHEADVSLANPFGPPVRGWSAAVHAMERAATHYREGRAVGFERMAGYTTPLLAYIVEMERIEAKIGGGEDITPVTLRVTTVFRPEDGTWKIVHRHADPIAAVRPADSVIQR